MVLSNPEFLATPSLRTETFRTAANIQLTEYTGESVMRALVIGGDGLLGSHLIRKLLAQDIETRVLIQPGSDSPTLDGLSIEKIQGDLLDEGDGLENAAKKCDYVFHVAAITNMWAPRDITWKVNYDATKSVIDACVKNDVSRMIFVGSASSYQFGSLESPGTEENPFPAVYKNVAYMESKFAAMGLVKQAVKDGRLDAVVIAPTFMLGDLDWRPSSGELVRQFVVRRMKAATPGGRNFAYAPDVADAMIAATTKGRPGESYLAAGANLTYLDFFGRVARLVGLEPPRKILPKAVVLAAGAAGSLAAKFTKKPVALNYTMARLALCGTYYSPRKAVEELGMPQTDVDTAIAKTVQSLREYGHIPK